VPIYEGYHSVVKAPGTNAYYLNVRQVIFCGSDSGIRVRVADHCLGRHRRNQPKWEVWAESPERLSARF